MTTEAPKAPHNFKDDGALFAVLHVESERGQKELKEWELEKGKARNSADLWSQLSLPRIQGDNSKCVVYTKQDSGESSRQEQSTADWSRTDSAFHLSIRMHIFISCMESFSNQLLLGNYRMDLMLVV